MNLSGVKGVTIPEGSVKEIFADGVKIWQAGRLPAGYTEVEYIQTDGNSWFDTGVNPSEYTDGIEYIFKGQRSAQNNANDYLFGCLVSGKRSGNVGINSGLGKTVLYLSNSGTALKKAPIPDLNTDFEIYVKATSEDASNAVFKYNGEVYDNEFSPADSDMPNANIYLCYCPNVGSTSRPFIGRVYNFIMNKADGTPIREFVPCKYRDGTAGMFDLVSGVFYGNAGTGTITAGPAV